MSHNPWRQPVNAHLRKAQALVALAVQQVDQVSRLTSEALLEGAIWQLDRALVAYYNELAENYQCPEAGQLNGLDQLRQALGALDKQPAELNELQIAHNEGWIARFLAAQLKIKKLKSAAATAVQMPRPGAIDTRQIDVDELDAEQVQGWCLRLRELVERQRELMVEF